MKMGIFLSAGALAVAAVAVAAMPLQDAKAKSKPDDKAMHGMDPAMAAKMKELGTLGPAHADMKKKVGTWNVSMKCWMDPSQPPSESTGTSTISLEFDRHMVENFSGEMPGMGHFDGRGVLAYNNATKEYEHVWRSSMDTGMMFSKGTMAADGTLTLTGNSHCVEGPMTCRMVTKPTGENTFTFEMYCSVQGKPEAKSMELHYTKK